MSIFRNKGDRVVRRYLEKLYCSNEGRTDNGDFYTINESRFYFHGKQSKPIWMIELPTGIIAKRDYEKYVFLNLDYNMALLDTKTAGGEIVWNTKSENGFSYTSHIHGERLYLPCKDGSVKVFDLSKLEK